MSPSRGTTEHDPATPSTGRWLLYGAYGYTGRLVAQVALARGQRPILSGRDPVRLAAMAEEFGLEHRAADLADAAQLATALDGVSAVAHCAGPFAATSAPMLAACLAAGVHYLDITGEIAVLEDVMSRDAAARDAGVALLPGSGFDVVPTDCLAATVAARVPDASVLQLAFSMGGGVSAGTARSAVGGMADSMLCRIGGVIQPAPRDRRRLDVPLARGGTMMSAVSWGDVATAWHSTGVDDIFVYTRLPRALGLLAGIASSAVRAPVAGARLQRLMAAAAGYVSPPTDAARTKNGGELWARATARSGATASARMTTPNGYDLTADAVVRIVRSLVDGDVPPGAHTPAQAFGAGFATTLDGVTLHDID